MSLVPGNRTGAPPEGRLAATSAAFQEPDWRASRPLAFRQARSTLWGRCLVWPAWLREPGHRPRGSATTHVRWEKSMGEKEVLVVISKLKSYIREKSDFNTAGSVAPKLSDVIRGLCDRAIENARKDGRKTVMDRDFD